MHEGKKCLYFESQHLFCTQPYHFVDWRWRHIMTKFNLLVWLNIWALQCQIIYCLYVNDWLWPHVYLKCGQRPFLLGSSRQIHFIHEVNIPKVWEVVNKNCWFQVSLNCRDPSVYWYKTWTGTNQLVHTDKFTMAYWYPFFFYNFLAS